jgi:hypothetical protein
VATRWSNKDSGFRIQNLKGALHLRFDQIDWNGKKDGASYIQKCVAPDLPSIIGSKKMM